MEAMSFVTEDRRTAQESTSPNTYTFDLFGGVDVSLQHVETEAYRANGLVSDHICCVRVLISPLSSVTSGDSDETHPHHADQFP